MNEMKPEIRVKEFKSEWTNQKLGNLADIVRGASPRPIQDPKWFDDDSDIGWLRISDTTKQNGRIDYLEQKISLAGQEKTRVLTEPHLLLSIAATVGKPVINYVKTGVHDGFLIFMKPRFEQEFMFQRLEMFRTRWRQYGQPGSQVNLNSEIVKKQSFKFPNMEEQYKIGQFFKQIDHKINIQQLELKKQKNFKQAMLQKMFPKEGETVPEIRFEGFNDEWKIVDLETLLNNEFKGNAKLNDLAFGKVEYLDAERLNGGTSYLTDGKKNVSKNDVLIIWDGSNAGKVYTGVEGVLGSTLKSFVINEKFYSQFVYQYLLKEERKIFQNYRTPNIPHVIRDFIKVFKIPITNYKEQKQIGNYFYKLDKLISTKQKELNKLKQFKQAMLDKMFV